MTDLGKRLSQWKFPVFPVRIDPPTKPGGKWQKRPLTPHGHLDRKPGPEWDGCWPAEANGVGVVWADLGEICVDLDEGHDAVWAFNNLPATRTHQTPSGQHHMIYACSERLSNSKSLLPAHVDIRSANGWSPLPGVSEGYTVVDDRPPVPLPPAIRAALKPIGEPNEARSSDYANEDEPEFVERARRWLATQPADCDGWPIAAALVRNFGLTDDGARELWDEWQADFAE